MTATKNQMLAGYDVLVLEDEPDSLEVVQTILSYYGATVYPATNGKEGLEQLEHVHPHFIISDISMPVMDGWEFIQALQADRALAEIPVIALTAHNLPGHRQRAIMEGFHNFMTKPLTASTFITQLLRLLTDIPEFEEMLAS